MGRTRIYARRQTDESSPVTFPRWGDFRSRWADGVELGIARPPIPQELLWLVSKSRSQPGHRMEFAGRVPTNQPAGYDGSTRPMPSSRQIHRIVDPFWRLARASGFSHTFGHAGSACLGPLSWRHFADVKPQKSYCATTSGYDLLQDMKEKEK
ncbi:hypothetical protein GGTG_01925 [Gaeumannomyces tritici R3-111a-1]|uniref:Uncharacterized protein n=1 Tax=Gaeumannomyces tritici (strain R3-111a-1) TaxID=644352 RepID=J3NKY4_GAET3|nr:hypothetical protein GGTG_01925 [Gaeumannomyces tritici R3-111a-1]EJT81951.1 hypothetical protein GGTG_01925 [Gaeumannomyces tritici R3-111a-1]